MNTIIKIVIYCAASLLLARLLGDAAWVVAGLGWLACIGIKEWSDGHEERARNAEAAETLRQLAVIHDQMMTECGMPEMVGKSSFHKE